MGRLRSLLKVCGACRCFRRKKRKGRTATSKIAPEFSAVAIEEHVPPSNSSGRRWNGGARTGTGNHGSAAPVRINVGAKKNGPFPAQLHNPPPKSPTSHSGAEATPTLPSSPNGPFRGPIFEGPVIPQRRPNLPCVDDVAEGNFGVELVRSAPSERWGFTWDAQLMEKRNMRIVEKVQLNTLAASWNCCNPGREIRPGDTLTKVNGKFGRMELITLELSQNHIVCEFKPTEPRQKPPPKIMSAGGKDESKVQLSLTLPLGDSVPPAVAAAANAGAPVGAIAAAVFAPALTSPMSPSPMPPPMAPRPLGAPSRPLTPMRPASQALGNGIAAAQAPQAVATPPPQSSPTPPSMAPVPLGIAAPIAQAVATPPPQSSPTPPSMAPVPLGISALASALEAGAAAAAAPTSQAMTPDPPPPSLRNVSRSPTPSTKASDGDGSLFPSLEPTVPPLAPAFDLSVPPPTVAPSSLGATAATASFSSTGAPPPLAPVGTAGMTPASHPPLMAIAGVASGGAVGSPLAMTGGTRDPALEAMPTMSPTSLAASSAIDVNFGAALPDASPKLSLSPSDMVGRAGGNVQRPMTVSPSNGPAEDAPILARSTFSSKATATTFGSATSFTTTSTVDSAHLAGQASPLSSISQHIIPQPAAANADTSRARALSLVELAQMGQEATANAEAPVGSSGVGPRRRVS